MERIDKEDSRVYIPATRAFVRSFVCVPAHRVVVKEGIPWKRSMACQVHYGGSAVRKFPSPCLQVHFFKSGELRDIAFFGGAPPLEPLRGVTVDAATLAAGLQEPSHRRLRDLLDLAANHAYTPLASIEIAPYKRQYDIILMIGSWRGSYRVKPNAFKASLGL